MPLADLIAPDINYISQRSVYPTAPGGTVASAGAAMSASTSVPYADAATGASVTSDGGTMPSQGGAHGLTYWLGLLTFLIILVWVARKTGSPEDFRNIKPTAYNMLAVTLTSIIGIVGLKVIFSKWRVAGLSDLILAV